MASVIWLPTARRTTPPPVAKTPAPRESPLAIEGDGLAAHFRAWLGRSGQRYIVSVHEMESDDPACDYDGALLLAVRRNVRGEPTLLDGRDSGESGAGGGNARWLTAMRGHGATELHVHLLARDRASRQRMLRDLVA